MVKSFTWFCCLLFIVGACNQSSKDKSANGDTIEAAEKDPSNKTLSYLALGDSYTIGEGVTPEERWPVILTNKLNGEGLSIDVPEIIATTGWTTDELRKGIEKRDLDAKFDLVSLLIGVNNQFRGFETEVYETEFKELLDIAIDYANGDVKKVFVVSIPDYGVTRFGSKHDPEKISVELDYYNKVGRSISEEKGVTFFNITEISRLAASDPELVAADELHPSGKMYKQWVDLMFPTVKAMLE